MKEKTRHLTDFTHLEASSICLGALVLSMGGKVIIQKEDAEVKGVLLDLSELETGDFQVQLLPLNKGKK